VLQQTYLSFSLSTNTSRNHMSKHLCRLPEDLTWVTLPSGRIAVCHIFLVLFIFCTQWQDVPLPCRAWANTPMYWFESGWWRLAKDWMSPSCNGCQGWGLQCIINLLNSYNPYTNKTTFLICYKTMLQQHNSRSVWSELTAPFVLSASPRCHRGCRQIWLLCSSASGHQQPSQ